MFGHDRSDVGQVVGHAFLDPLDHLPAEQIVHGVEVIGDRGRMGHRANQAELIGHLRQHRVKLAQLHARDPSQLPSMGILTSNLPKRQ